MAAEDILLALELSWKLQDQCLFPALYDAHGSRALFAAEEDALGRLRDLAQQVRSLSTQVERQQIVLTALQGAAMVHNAAIERLVARHGGALDMPVLQRQMDALTRRWQHEVRATGDIEDEECDPVGLPPR